ncbi:GMC family oxidoreductase N-terminal domain-containing protein [Actinokineospora sp. HUAS TT18]|uniref:GMC family oxidoreductase N-terminal domain-containing protein n=1 Tax=Actinokineospora sp. HUAS TT18 TaxID=3447451 RepID=UPI003F523BF4
MTVETTDVAVIGSGFGGAIPGYRCAAAGARVVILERGPRLHNHDFEQDLAVGTYTKAIDAIIGDGVTVLAGNCVGGSSVVYYAASLRAPSFVFDRQGSLGARLWPAALTRVTLDPWYERIEASLPVAQQSWSEISYAGGLFAAACANAGRTCNPVPVAVDLTRCVNCNWMLAGCQFDAKRSLLLNYLPAAEAHGAQIRPLHEVQSISPALTPGYRYRLTILVFDAGLKAPVDTVCLESKVAVLAAGAVGTPVILQRSTRTLGDMPAAVGRYFSGNGDRVSIAVMSEDRVRDVLGLSRAPGIAYDAFPIGKAITTMCFDRLDGSMPEFERFSLQQIYFPPITNALASAPEWWGLPKKQMRSRWRSWLTLLAMTEDDNEGTFGVPPPTGSFTRIGPALGMGSMRYRPSPSTRRGWASADAELRGVFERDALATVSAWHEEPGGTVTAHPLGSCRIGDDPAVSALDHRHELRGHPGLFVTDGAAVPTALCVNPSLTIAALADRASSFILDRLASSGVPVRQGLPSPLR